MSQCQAIKADGTQCTRKAMNGSQFCFQHDAQAKFEADQDAMIRATRESNRASDRANRSAVGQSSDRSVARSSTRSTNQSATPTVSSSFDEINKIKMDDFLKYADGEGGVKKKGLAFCAGFNQSLEQFDHVRRITGVNHWVTVDYYPDSNPTLVLDASDSQSRQFLQPYYGKFDVIFLPRCATRVYTVINHATNDDTFNITWFKKAIMPLLAKGGQVVFLGLNIDMFMMPYIDTSTWEGLKAFNDASEQRKRHAELRSGKSGQDAPFLNKYHDKANEIFSGYKISFQTVEKRTTIDEYIIIENK